MASLAAASAGGEEAKLARPSDKQIQFADWEVGAFIHYGLNVYTGQEHGDGQEPPSKFNPTELDAEQWVLTAKSMGARYACLTARHEGGFCLWPSKTTEYTVANSPYKDGKGDIVREFVEACRRHGLGVGLYHTAAFNAHEALLGYQGEIDSPLRWPDEWGKATSAAFKADPSLRERFDQIQIEQFRELLTNYGQIDFMWSDHWNASDPHGLWRAVTDLAEELQPNMVMMGPDTWVPGNETGHVVYPMWNAVNTVDGTKYSRPAPTEADNSVSNDYGLLETDVLTGHPLGKFWRVRECTTHRAFHHGGWFWHPDNVKKTYPLTLNEHVDLYYRTVGLGANTIINLPPDTRGLVPDNLADAAKALGDEIRRRFDEPIAEVTTVQTGDTVELSWRQPQEINTVVTMEHIARGQKVAKYTLEAEVDGRWQRLEPANNLIAWAPYNSNPGYQTIGHKKIDRVVPVTTNHIRFRCLESVAEPVEIRRLAVYHIQPLKQDFAADYPYLSGLPTISETAHGGVVRDTNYTGNTIHLGGESYDYGVFMHPLSQGGQAHAEWDLAELAQAKGMEAVIGIEDATDGRGSCIFIVQGYRDGRWSELYRSPLLRGGMQPANMSVEFPAQLSRIRLIAKGGPDGTNSDHAVWANARFIE